MGVHFVRRQRAGYIMWSSNRFQDSHFDCMRQGRELPAETVLPLLRGVSSELCCQYLEYLVGSKGSQDPAHHTELALGLADAALRLMPPVDTGSAAPCRHILSFCRKAG